MADKRPGKFFRLNYAKKDPAAVLAILGEPSEIKIAAGDKSFISVKEDGVSIGGGLPSKVNIQGFSGSIKYAGMLSDIPFPMNIMPITPYNPLPQQVAIPPLAEMMAMIQQVATLASLFVG